MWQIVHHEGVVALIPICLIRNLSAFMIHMIIFPVNKLGNRYKFIPHFFQSCDHGIQCSSGVFGTVMAKDDTAIAQMFMLGNCIDNGFCAVIFPVQAVTVRYKSKDNYFGVIFIEILRCFSKKKILPKKNSI